ncbi:MAG: hypothetical protein EOM58_02095, partial [Clostridia bacterium]|nr:hypothetical protein [Clostridia bacterium]
MAFTPAQEAAIRARNPELLVSAAAGSGKTRVLIERIFDLLVNDHFSVDRLLVVTFTHAAAAEMRERLQTRIAEAALTDRRMRRQAELMESAQISTLHSFCQKLVRQYFQTVEIDPQAMLGETTVCANLLAQAQQEALDWLYEQAAEQNPDSVALTAKFEEKQIAGMLEELYPFLMALPDPFEWLDSCARKSYTQDDLLHGPMADAMLSDCALLLDGAMEIAKASLALTEDPLCPAGYASTMKADAQAVEELVAGLSGGIAVLADAVGRFALPRLPSLRNLEGREAEIRDAYKSNRDEIKKVVEALQKTLPARAETELDHINRMQPALAGLAAYAREMDQRYADLKQERNLLDFHDLERMALRILRDPEISAEVAAGFDGVFVDEYQDISGVQEAILNALKPNVSRETNSPAPLFFYVGDVKQSIYRFRQADPTLFMHKASTFSSLEHAPQRRITLNANFRSRETVLGTVNRVFEQIMRADVTEIAYDEEARLNAGLPSKGDTPTSLHLFTQRVRAAERVKLQAYAIGQEIKRRVGEPVLDRDGNPAGTLRYRDIAILGPRMKDVSGVLERTFAEMGIPVYSEDNGSGMRSEEITQALQHLRLMDQLADDLALLSCLRSPAIGLDERELAAIRLDCMQGSFLEALQKQATQETALGARCAAILDNLREERFLLSQSPPDEYLWGWLNRSGMYAFYGCQSNGRLRQANLRMLCQKAGEHVQRRGGDLRDFLDSVESQTGVQDSTSPTVLSPWEDVVRVMTIHKSKGLEFPVVFVIGLENTFGSHSRGQLALHPRLGVALPYVNEKARTTGDTMLKSAIRLRVQAEEKAERARLLYVAMTRARDELILMGCGDQLMPEDAGRGFAGGGTPSAYQVFSAKSMLMWITACVRPGDQALSWETHSDGEELSWKTAQ